MLCIEQKWLELDGKAYTSTTGANSPIICNQQSMQSPLLLNEFSVSIIHVVTRMFDVFVDMVLSHHSKKDKVIFGIFEIGKLRHTHKTRAHVYCTPGLN